MENEIKKKVNPYERKYVSKEDFAELADSVKGLVDIVKGLKNVPSESAKESRAFGIAPPKVEGIKGYEEEGISTDVENPLPATWKNSVSNILGADFGIHVIYPSNGGCLVRIEVPREKSNAGSTHLDFYKHDYRTKSFSGMPSADSVAEWCKRIKQNLEAKK